MAFGNCKVFPLTVLKIQTVASLFKAGRYSSYRSYIGRARKEHLSLIKSHGAGWEEDLEEEFRDSIRTVFRGIGPSKQSLPLPIHACSERCS